MDLLDRYLAAVAALLPKAQREDIVAELRDLLLNQMEEKEARLGRPLRNGEREEVLRAFGHPIAVAGRFGTPRALIGPELYPFYMFAVKGLVVLAAAVTAIPTVISVILGGENGAGALARFLSDFLTAATLLIGAATIVAAGIERGWIPLGKSLDWKVADLPRLDHKLGKIKSRFEASFELSAILVFILWWTGAVETPWSPIVGGHGLFLQAPPIWTTLFLPILALAVVKALASLATLVRPEAIRARAGLDMVGDLGGLGLVAMLWPAGSLVTVAPQGLTGPRGEEVAGLQAALDQSFQITLAVMAVVLLGQLAFHAWRLLRGAVAPRAAVA